MKDNLIQNGKVDFKVEKVWLAENQLSKESIALFHYVTDAWTELPTTVGVEDDAYVHYSASTPGFSYFVIGEKVIAQAPAAEQATAEQPAVPEATPAVQPASEMKQLNAISWIVTLIVAAVIVAVVIAYFRKRR